MSELNPGRFSPRKTWKPSPSRSTTGPARASTGRHPRKYSKNSYAYSNNPVLQRPVESSQYRSWIFGHRLRQAGLLGLIGKVASSVDNALIESFWSSMQAELLDRQSWTSRVQLASGRFERIEGWHNPERRHSSLGMVSPAHFEQLDNNVMVAA
jgi:hypothetical protein